MTGSKRVLVVDDDAGIREVTSDILELGGYEVLTAANGADALEQARANPPDAIVLDLRMPVMDGLQFLAACRQDGLCDGTQVLVMSAYNDLIDAACDLGVSASVVKPFQLAAFVQVLERLLQQPAQ